MRTKSADHNGRGAYQVYCWLAMRPDQEPEKKIWEQR